MKEIKRVLKNNTKINASLSKQGKPKLELNLTSGLIVDQSHLLVNDKINAGIYLGVPSFQKQSNNIEKEEVKYFGEQRGIDLVENREKKAKLQILELSKKYYSGDESKKYTLNFVESGVTDGDNIKERVGLSRVSSSTQTYDSLLKKSPLDLMDLMVAYYLRH